MGNYSDAETDERLTQLEKRIRSLYSQAYADMRAKWKDYVEGYDDADGKHHLSLQERYDREYKAFQRGEYTEDEFKLWYQTQIQRGERYRQLADDLATTATQADLVAQEYINGDTPSIFALNSNFMAYEINNITGVAFNIYNEEAIRLLMDGTSNHVEFLVNGYDDVTGELRYVHVDGGRAYEWNRQQIEKALASGIAQGKDIYSIADQFLQVMKRDQASAIRNARTAYTSAQNGGRHNTALRALERGLKIRKVWIATLDERTRLSHSLLNGQVREIKEPFSNGLMYPSDPAGAPAEVYNCRCAYQKILPDYETKESVERHTDYLDLSEEEQKEIQRSYRKWQREQTEAKIRKDGTYKKKGYFE